MRALMSETAGGPETLVFREAPRPEPAPGCVVVEVFACGVNYPDFLLIQDLYQVRPERPFSPGSEVSGRIVALGDGVEDLSVGDAVICRCGWGGMAEFIGVEQSRCYRIPDGIPFADAATFLFTYSTVHYAFHDRCQLAPGETLLVLGASGGIGCAAIDLGRAMGARVIAAASTEDKLAFAMARGCDDGVVYGADLSDKADAADFSRRLKGVLGPGLADVILDPVGGPYCEAALRAIAPGGRLGIVGFTAGIAKIPMNLPLLKSCQIVGVDWRSYTLSDLEGSRSAIRDLCQMYLDGRIRPAVTDTLPFDRAPEAIARLGRREATGKLVVLVKGG